MLENIRRKLFAVTGLLVLATSFALTDGGFVQDASAAGLTTKPDMSACFRWGGVAYSNQPVYLAAYYSGEGWKTTRSTTTNSSGCVRFNDITPGRYYQIAALKAWSELCYYYHGVTPVIYSGAATDRLFAMGTYYMTIDYWC